MDSIEVIASLTERVTDNVEKVIIGKRAVLELAVILVVTFIVTTGLAYLLRRINHRVKFAPIILIILLIRCHLPRVNSAARAEITTSIP